MKVKERFPETLLIFVTPPSAEELKKRLIGRGTETMEVIRERLSRAIQESEAMDAYDYILVNDNLEVCTEELHQMIQMQHRSAKAQKAFADEMKKELLCLEN